MFLFSNFFGRKKWFGQLARTFWANGKQIQNLFVKTKHTELKQERDIIGLPVWLRYDQTGLVNLPIV